MKPNRAPNTIWISRIPPIYPNAYVLTAPNDEIRVSVFESEDDAVTFYMSRKDARLLAKRINQCLDGTAKR